MFERLNLEDIPDVGFLIDPFVRHNLYKYPEILENWSGEKFEPIINAIIDVVEPNARRRSYFSSKYFLAHFYFRLYFINDTESL